MKGHTQGTDNMAGGSRRMGCDWGHGLWRTFRDPPFGRLAEQRGPMFSRLRRLILSEPGFEGVSWSRQNVSFKFATIGEPTTLRLTAGG